MRPFMVVLLHPLRIDLLDLFQTVEQMRIEDFLPKRAIKAFNKRILIRFARFD